MYSLNITRTFRTSVIKNAAKNKRKPRKSKINEEDLKALAAIRDEKFHVEEKQISAQAREMKVPSNRLERITAFAPLVGHLGMKIAKQTVTSKFSSGSKNESSSNKHDYTSSNQEMYGKKPDMKTLELMVNTLARTRGAALKIAQVISIQDNEVVPKYVTEIFDRVRESADFMPFQQVESQLKRFYGDNWRDTFQQFEDKPFAAASIGQVHRAVVDGVNVAVKIQYPGVAQSIDSDVKNLSMVLPLLNLPASLYAETSLEQARKELHMEVDYVREAAMQNKMIDLFEDANLTEFVTIPSVVQTGSCQEILSTEYMENCSSLDKCVNLDQETKNHIARQLVKICLEQLFIFRTMQTDPNWGNYMWNGEKIIMLDFGGTQEYEKDFIDTYIKIINAAVENDPKTIEEESIKIAFLTGYESKEMIKAHVDSVLILGEFLRSEEPYDFAKQGISKRIARDQIPEMVKGRLTPPPLETYSIHRALAGVFLAAAKLDAKIVSLDLWKDMHQRYYNQEA